MLHQKLTEHVVSTLVFVASLTRNQIMYVLTKYLYVFKGLLINIISIQHINSTDDGENHININSTAIGIQK